MKNILLGSAVSALLLSGAAHAVTTVDPETNLPVINEETTYVVYLSGASAPRKFIEELLTNPGVSAADAICDASKSIWKYKDSINGTKQNAYLCDINKANPALASLPKANLLIYKSSENGSAQGVSPIVAEAKGAPSDIPFLKIDPALCTSNTLPSPGVLGDIECTYSENDAALNVQVTPDFGVSDVDPGQFTGLNTPAGFAPVLPADVALLAVQPTAALTFGVPVTKNLFYALQEAQFGKGDTCVENETDVACLPSLTKAQIASIHTAQIISWDQLVTSNGDGLYTFASAKYKPANVAAIPDTAANAFDDTVHICRRVPGSGTQAQHGIKFLHYPCTDAASTPASGNTAVFGGGATEDDGVTLVHALSGSGDVTDCLNMLDQGVVDAGADMENIYGKRWAIGIQSLEKNAGLGDDFRFVKVDGVAPTLENVASGKYYDWVELTFQYSKTHGWDAGEQTIADAVIKSAGSPVVLAKLNEKFVHYFGQSGFMAVPTQFDAATDGSIDLAAPVNPYTHATVISPTDNCRVPARITGGDFEIGIEL